MQSRRKMSSPWLALVAGTGLLALVQQAARADGPGCPPAPCPFPQIAPQTAPPPIAPAPGAPRPATPGQPAPGQPQQPEAAQPPSTDLSLDQRFAGLGGESVSVPNMIGDQPVVSPGFSSSTSSSSSSSARLNAAAARGSIVKIADNQNALPQDRVFFTFNYFNDVNHAIIRHEDLDIGKMDIYVYTLGFEKTLMDGNASVGLRVPLVRVNADNGFTPGTGGDFQDVGDLTIFGKYILLGDRQSSVLTAGLAVTVPTGPRNLGGSPDTIITGFHDTLIQPFLGWRCISGNWYLQGFEAVLIPTDSEDVTLLTTDVGLGYFLARNRSDGAFLTAVIPTVEAHLNNPLSHRGAFNEPFGVPDWMDLTQGVILEFNRHSQLTVGVAEAVTGPRPYAVEGIVQFNFLW
jgi:hypothetical protein